MHRETISTSSSTGARRPWCDRPRRRDRRRAYGARAAGSRVQGRYGRPGARHAARRHLLRGGAAVRGRELRRGRRARIAAHHFADVAGGRLARWRASRRSRSSSSTRSSAARTSRRQSAYATPRTSATTPRRSGARFFAGAGLEVDDVAFFSIPARARAWLARTECIGEDAEASCGPARRPDRRRRHVVFERIALRGATG